jgi:hypothetical protein
VPPKLPLPLPVNLTVPVGVLLAPAAVSVTVAVQVIDCPTTTVAGEQLTLVELARVVTVTVAVPLLAVCVESPP